MTDPPPFRSRLIGAAMTGGLMGGLGATALALLLPSARAALSAGGWWLAIFGGAALGGFASARWARGSRERLTALLAGVILLLVAVGVRVESPPEQGRTPRGPRATARALLRWSYESPQAVGRILPYARDADPTVREQAVLALGVNRVVSDLERTAPGPPAAYERRLGDSLRAGAAGQARAGPGAAAARARPGGIARPHPHHSAGLLRASGLRAVGAARLRALV